jgi:hypothetical protein
MQSVGYWILFQYVAPSLLYRMQKEDKLCPHSPQDLRRWFLFATSRDCCIGTSLRFFINWLKILLLDAFILSRVCGSVTNNNSHRLQQFLYHCMPTRSCGNMLPSNGCPSIVETVTSGRRLPSRSLAMVICIKISYRGAPTEASPSVCPFLGTHAATSERINWFWLNLILELTSWSWALLEKPPIVQLLKNFATFYGTRRFITVITRALHGSLSWARSIQSIPSHLPKIHCNIIHTYLRLGLSSGLFPSDFPTKILYAFLFFPPLVLHALPVSSSLSWSF